MTSQSTPRPPRPRPAAGVSHTPGPWYSIGHSILGDKTHAVVTGGTYHMKGCIPEKILMTRGEDGLLVPLDGTPNGNLILAAPDLLAACEKWLKFLVAVPLDMHIPAELVEPLIEARNATNVALTKAKGAA